MDTIYSVGGKVKDRGLVEKWLIFAQYRKENNIPPWKAVDATITINAQAAP